MSIDDGSKDDTVEKLQARPELFSRLLELPKNGGKGAAVKEGLKAATGEYILFQDADLEYDPVDYADLFVPLREFDSDIVFGSRIIAPRYIRVHLFWHKVGNRGITFLFNLLFNTTFSDIYSCYLLRDYKVDISHATSTLLAWLLKPRSVLRVCSPHWSALGCA